MQWLPLLATIAGWAVVNHQNNQRELRKEQRALADAAKKLIAEIAKSAGDYMCAQPRDEAAESSIKLALDQLEIELSRCMGYSSSPLVDQLSSFANAATGGDFESNSRKARSRSDPDYLLLMVARNTLLAGLERHLQAQFAGWFNRVSG